MCACGLGVGLSKWCACAMHATHWASSTAADMYVVHMTRQEQGQAADALLYQSYMRILLSCDSLCIVPVSLGSGDDQAVLSGHSLCGVSIPELHMHIRS
jgi:hypothetical protein